MGINTFSFISLFDKCILQIVFALATFYSSFS